MLNDNERKEIIDIIHKEYGYNKQFLQTKSDNELYDKILRNELISKYKKSELNV